jgi:formate C-acetyltransferase
MNSTIETRIDFLKAQTLNWKEVQRPYIGRRLYHALKGLAQTNPSTPWMKRKAVMLASILENMQPEIHPRELVVGYNYYGSDDGQWLEVGLIPRRGRALKELQDYLSPGQLSEAEIAFIISALKKTESDLSHPAYYLETPPEYTQAEQEGLICAWATPENHTVIGYEKVLRLGFRGICEEIEKSLQELDWSNPAAPERKLLLESALRVAEAACGLGRRYAQKARELLAESQGESYDPQCIADLEAILTCTSQVPENPARTFHEAVQSLWFAHIINTWEDGINANSLGRIDQILYPYYQRDLESGRIDETQARELLACLWLKLYRDYDVQQVTLGGVDSRGSDATNALTYLMLDVTESVDLIRCMGVRLHRHSPERLLQRCLEIVGRGKGVPFFFNDDALVPALTASGISIEDARDYANIGCVETTIPGKANPHAVSNRINLLKCLELALNDGVSLTTGVQVGPQTGKVETMHGLVDVMSAYQQQVEHFLTLACFQSNRCELTHSLTRPMPYKSMLTAGCLESGRDFNAGGALYNYHETMALGIPNVADSLAALDELVYAADGGKEKKYSLGEIVAQMKANFPDEHLRRELQQDPPKYGNDDETVDRYAAWAFEGFCDALLCQRSVWGQGYFAQPFTFLWHLEMGAKTGATPDGRRSGEIFAYSLSPMQGRDRSGLTAVLNSLARLPHHRAAGSTSAIIELDPQLFESENLPLLVRFLQTAVQKGVGQLQFNVVTEETLRKAQADPDSYQNLAVRVSGFSQRFCLLSKELQDHIIARTKHTR